MHADEWREIHDLHAGGASIRQIAARLNMARNTVRRALTFDDPPDDHRRRQGSLADEADASIRKLLTNEPDIGIAEISRRIGWSHSRTPLARRVRAIREEPQAAAQDGLADRLCPSELSTTTSFIGRTAEIRELRSLLGIHRLVTITGPGGVGKTRLVAVIAHEFRPAFPDGIWLVELSGVRDPGLVAHAVADALGLSYRNSSQLPTAEVIGAFLRRRRALLILDNCEHLLDECANLVSGLIHTAHDLVVLTTSREILDITDEVVYILAPLPISKPGAGAVDLFIDRAAATLPNLAVTPDVRRDIELVCKRLDGLPLAIELACVRLRVLSVAELAERLGHRLNLLTAGSRTAPHRHRSLQAAMDWSFELCSEAEKKLWSRSSVFVGSFDLTAAELICADEQELPRTIILDSLSALVAKSVLNREEVAGRVSFSMLESIREFGLSHLSDTDRQLLEHTHHQWCLSQVREMERFWFSDQQHRVSCEIRLNRSNLRSALQRLLGSPDTADHRTAAEILAHAKFLWACGLSVKECRMWLERAIEASADADPVDVCWILSILGILCTIQGDRENADAALRRAQKIDCYRTDQEIRGLVLNGLGLSALFDGEYGKADEHLAAAAAAHRSGESRPEFVCMVQIHRGFLAAFVGDAHQAEHWFRTVEVATTSVGEVWLRSYAVWGRALVALLRDRGDEALVVGRASLQLQSVVGDPSGTTLIVDLLAWAESSAGSQERAAELLGAASSMWSSIGEQLYGADQLVDKRTSFQSSARAALGERCFARRFGQGASLSLPELMEFALTEAEEPASVAPAEAGVFDALTARESEVLRYVTLGFSNREIASRMILSPRTVEGHLDRIRMKLGVRRRTELVAIAARRGEGH